MLTSLPTTVPAPPPSLTLDQLSKLGFWDAYLALPAPLEAAIIAGIIALPLGLATLAATLRSIAVAKEAKEIASEKLFSDLLKTRIEWHESFKEAVADRQKELTGKLEDIASNTESVASVKIHQRRQEASWFFEKEITGLISDIEKEFVLQRTNIIGGEQLLDDAAPRAKIEAAHHAANVTQLMKDLGRVLKPFLYVGHIKQTRPEAKAGPRISGIFRGGLIR